MSTIYVDGIAGEDTSTGSVGMPVRTIAQATLLTAVGDTVLVDQATYRERVLPLKANLTYKAASGARPVVDGEFVRQHGFYSNSTAQSGLRIEGFEICNVTFAGIFSGRPQNWVGNETFHNNLIHHVVNTSINEYGMFLFASNPQVTDSEIHSVGHGGESWGIFAGSCKDHVIDGNLMYLCRKAAIRDWESLSGQITNNRIFQCWIGIESNGCIGSLNANNYLSFNQVGFYPKHCNNPAPLTKWGFTAETVPAWVRFWHNTVYASRWAACVIATNTPTLDRLDIQNNIFEGPGQDFIHDSPPSRTTNITFNHNVYSTRTPVPADVYRKNFNNPIQAGDTLTYAQLSSTLGWEVNGLQIDPALIDPENGDLDYLDASPAHNAGASLASSWGTQMGARDLPASRVTWTGHHATGLTTSWGVFPPVARLFDDRAWTLIAPTKTGNDWATADLGSLKTITHFWQDPYAHNVTLNVRAYRWDVSTDNVVWTTVGSGAVTDTQAATPWHEIAGGAVEARYIRFTMLTNFGVATIGTSGVGAGAVVEHDLPEETGGGWGILA